MEANEGVSDRGRGPFLRSAQRRRRHETTTVTNSPPQGAQSSRTSSQSYKGRSVFLRRPLQPVSSLSLFFLLANFLTQNFLCPLAFSGHTVAAAANCTTTARQLLDVSSSTANLSSAFSCEHGSFEVTWSGVVSITASIVIGRGTTVSISGDRNSSFNASDFDSSSGGVEGTTTGSATVATTGLRFGPMFVVNGSSLYLEGVLVRDGYALAIPGNKGNGGGVYAEDANVTIVGCTFEDNFAMNSGGGVYAMNSRLVVSNTVFRRCAANDTTATDDDEPEQEGGGIEVTIFRVFSHVSFHCTANL